MVTFIGEFDCKLDPKGRLSLPAGLHKQFDAAYKDRFVINRSIFQKCLILYPMNTWESIVQDLFKLNRFVKENDTFIRQFTNGAITVEADSANRLLIPKRLMDYASIEKEVILSANLNKIEIWSADKFNKVMDEFDQESFESLAERVMSRIDTNKS